MLCLEKKVTDCQVLLQEPKTEVLMCGQGSSLGKSDNPLHLRKKQAGQQPEKKTVILPAHWP